ncbi:MAG: iron-containing redox enzyme family protein [Gammaproteobacteria bacterium]|nr:iron-containing redox enzyme family protein [Gammaproteobacteria bacterium]
MKPYERLKKATAVEQQYLLEAPIHTRLAAGDIDLNGYHTFLANAYHHVRYTVALMMAAASRTDPSNKAVCATLQEYINEEVGHEQWILNDLQACGGNPQEVIKTGAGLEVEVMVAFVRDYINQINPIGFFGMVYVLEGTSVAMATSTADLVQRTLTLPDSAFSYLRSHGSLDIDHLIFFENFINTLSDTDVRHIIHVAKRVYYLYGNVLRSIPNTHAQHVAA